MLRAHVSLTAATLEDMALFGIECMLLENIAVTALGSRLAGVSPQPVKIIKHKITHAISRTWEPLRRRLVTLTIAITASYKCANRLKVRQIPASLHASAWLLGCLVAFLTYTTGTMSLRHAE